MNASRRTETDRFRFVFVCVLVAIVKIGAEIEGICELGIGEMGFLGRRDGCLETEPIRLHRRTNTKLQENDLFALAKIGDAECVQLRSAQRKTNLRAAAALFEHARGLQEFVAVAFELLFAEHGTRIVMLDNAIGGEFFGAMRADDIGVASTKQANQMIEIDVAGDGDGRGIALGTFCVFGGILRFLDHTEQTFFVEILGAIRTHVETTGIDIQANGADEIFFPEAGW